MAFLKIVILSLCGLLAVDQSMAQLIGIGGCPSNIKVVQNFDAEKFLGKWYENQKTFSIDQVGGKCTTATYSATDEANVVAVYNKQFNTITQQINTIEGTATLVSTTGEAKLEVRFPSVPFVVAPYWVLGTDYDNFAVVYSCNSLLLAHTRSIWILTREQNPSAEVYANAYAVLEANNIDRDDLIVTDHTDCPADTL